MARACGSPGDMGVKVQVECPEGSRPVVCLEEGRPLEVTCEGGA